MAERAARPFPIGRRGSALLVALFAGVAAWLALDLSPRDLAPGAGGADIAREFFADLALVKCVPGNRLADAVFEVGVEVGAVDFDIGLPRNGSFGGVAIGAEIDGRAGGGRFVAKQGGGIAGVDAR